MHPKKQHQYDTDCLVRSFLERLSLLGVSRVFALSYYQVYHQLNVTCLTLPNFKTPIVDCKTDKGVLEFDELCGFCGKKANKQWVWAALCKDTRQIVGYVIGDRSEATFKRLLRKIPPDYLRPRGGRLNPTAIIGKVIKYFAARGIIGNLEKTVAKPIT